MQEIGNGSGRHQLVAAEVKAPAIGNDAALRRVLLVLRFLQRQVLYVRVVVDIVVGSDRKRPTLVGQSVSTRAAGPAALRCGRSERSGRQQRSPTAPSQEGVLRNIHWEIRGSRGAFGVTVARERLLLRLHRGGPVRVTARAASPRFTALSTLTSS